MSDSLKIEPQIDQVNIFDGVSGLERLNARKRNPQRNDNPVSRFFKQSDKGKSSRKAAIDAFCAHCVGCSAKEQGIPQEDWIEPGFREMIRDCSSYGCPLRQFRPFKKND